MGMEIATVVISKSWRQCPVLEPLLCHVLIFPCTIKSRSSPSGTGSPRRSRRKGRKMVVVVVMVCYVQLLERLCLSENVLGDGCSLMLARCVSNLPRLAALQLASCDFTSALFDQHLSSLTDAFQRMLITVLLLLLWQGCTVLCPLPSSRHHWSNSDCLEGKRENYLVCSVQYCVQQLCTHISTDRTVLWIEFCLTGPISLCLDSFLYFVYHCILYACVGL